GTTWHAGTWVEGTDAYALVRSVNWDDIYSSWQSNQSSLKLVDLDVHDEAGTRIYTGVWRQGPAQQEVVFDVDWPTFEGSWKELSVQGFRLVRVAAASFIDSTHFTGLFERGDGGYALLDTADWKQFHAYYQRNAAAMQMVDFHVRDEAGTRWYI